MSGYHQKDLISEVKKRPGIYNKDVLEPPRREHKHRLWAEVAECLTPSEEWESYTELEKEARMDEIQNKWKHLRDHYYREIKLQEAGEAHKKRKYIYFDDMDFMRPYVGYKLPPKRPEKSFDSQEFDDTHDLEGNSSDIDMDSFLKTNDTSGAGSSSKRETRSSTNRLSKPSPKTEENKTLIKNFTVLKKSDDPTNPSFKVKDGDISFSLSLVPTLRKMTDGHKIRAKIEILKVLQRYIDHIERRTAAERNIVKNFKRSATEADKGDEMADEDNEQKANVKRVRNNDPLNSSGDNKKSWWT